MYWVYKALRHCVDFSGRAGRREYWSFFLFVAVGDVILGALYCIPAALGYNAGAGPARVAMLALAVVLLLVGLALVVPSVSAAVRRLHDLDRSGLWALLLLLPIAGWLWLAVLLASAGAPGPNRYGEVPEEAAADIEPEDTAPMTEEEPAASLAPQSVVVTGLALSRAEAAFGEEVAAEVDYVNPAGEACTAEIKIFLNGVAAASLAVEVPAGESGKAEIPVPYEFVGEYAVKAGEFSQILTIV